jgi:SAM-dependent methyltransferase
VRWYSDLKIWVEKVLPSKYYPKIRAVYSYIRSLPYLGDRFECPCCGGRFRKFNSFGANLRPNVQCPRCLSLDRHRLQWLYFKDKTNLFTAPVKMLHVAPESVFRQAFMTMPNIEYLSVDLSSPLAMVTMDITNIEIEDDYFNVIICNHVLEHVPDDIKAMRELFRVLKPGGWAILQVPITREKTLEDPTAFTPAARLKLFGQGDHVRAYGLDYRERLESVGFNVKVDRYARELSDDMIERYRLPKNEDIYFCSKPKTVYHAST